jgi:predicted CDP-diglyceride synthetase/phosphatidate cytidylyltransferase
VCHLLCFWQSTVVLLLLTWASYTSHQAKALSSPIHSNRKGHVWVFWEVRIGYWWVSLQLYWTLLNWGLLLLLTLNFLRFYSLSELLEASPDRKQRNNFVWEGLESALLQWMFLSVSFQLLTLTSDRKWDSSLGLARPAAKILTVLKTPRSFQCYHQRKGSKQRQTTRGSISGAPSVLGYVGS